MISGLKYINKGYLVEPIKDIIQPLLIGSSISILICIDPYISSRLNIYLGDIDPFRTIPYLITILFLVILSLILIVKVLSISREGINRFLLFALLMTPFVTFLNRTGIRFGIMILTLCIGLWLMRGFYAGEIVFVKSPIYLMILVFLLPMLISSLIPIGGVFRNLFSIFDMFTSRILLVFFVINIIYTKWDLLRCINYLLYLGFASSLIAICQLIIYLFSGINLSFASGEQAWIYLPPPFGKLPRVTALMLDPNELGAILAVLSAIALYFSLSDSFSIRRRLLYIVEFFFGFVAIVLTWSRTAWVALGFSFFLIPFARRSYLSIYIMSGIILLGIIGYLGGFINILTDILVSLGEGSISFREDLFYIGLDDVRRYPMTGVGFNASSEFNNPYDEPIHNGFLQVAAETGLWGLFIFLGIFIYIIIKFLILLNKNRDKEFRWVVKALFVGYLSFPIIFQSQPFAFEKFFWLFIGLCEALFLVFREKRRFI